MSDLTQRLADEKCRVFLKRAQKAEARNEDAQESVRLQNLIIESLRAKVGEYEDGLYLMAQGKVKFGTGQIISNSGKGAMEAYACRLLPEEVIERQRIILEKLTPETNDE